MLATAIDIYPCIKPHVRTIVVNDDRLCCVLDDLRPRDAVLLRVPFHLPLIEDFFEPVRRVARRTSPFDWLRSRHWIAILTHTHSARHQLSFELNKFVRILS